MNSHSYTLLLPVVQLLTRCNNDNDGMNCILCGMWNAFPASATCAVQDFI